MFKLFRSFTKRDIVFLLLAVLFIVFQVWLDLKLPDYMSEITRLVQTEGSDFNEILKNGGGMLLCALGSLIAAVFVGFLISGISAHFSMNVRKKLFYHVEELDMNDVKKFSIASLITRTTNDITQVQMFIAMGLQMLIKAPITAVWAVFKILDKSWEWSAMTALAVIIILSAVAVIMALVIPRFKLVQQAIDKLNGVSRENITGIRVVRAFNAEKYQKQKFETTNRELTGLQLFNQRVFSVMEPVMYLVLNGLSLAIYITGTYFIHETAMPAEKLTIFSNMVVFSSYAMQVIMSFLSLVIVFTFLPRAKISANRINEVLDTKPTILDGDLENTNAGQTGIVEFKNVSFKYPDAEEYLLKDISFKAEPGQTIAFIGSTGSGKSTLINLVPRFYDATEGEVLIDGINVKDYKLEDLNNKLGYVSQKAVIMSGTVSSNVAYGDNGKGKTTETAIRQAIKIAQGTEFVEKMDKTYHAHIAQGGTNISGGQKQRLAIARAIARDPEIYIFDDSFSALDYKTDAVLRKELKKYTKNATSLIVAQRIGTIMNADQILVLDNGFLVGKGTHQELLKSCPVYKEIAESQLSKEELRNA